MLVFIRICILLALIGMATRSAAQDGFFETSKIPLDSNINLTLVSRDTVSLDYYSLYTFQYKAGTAPLQAQFMLPKHTDTYRGKKQASVKLCRLTSFVNSWQGIEGNPIPVADFVEVVSPYSREKIHLNLDPEMPDPVFTICGTQKSSADKQ